MIIKLSNYQIIQIIKLSNYQNIELSNYRINFNWKGDDHFIKTMTTTTSPVSSLKTLVIDQSTFRHLVRQTIKDFSPANKPHGLQSEAARVLQESAEAFLVEMFKKGQLNCGKWDNRDIVLPRDLISGLWDMDFDYLTLSKRGKPQNMLTLFEQCKK